MTILMEIVFTVNNDRAFLPCYDSGSTINQFDEPVTSASVNIKMIV